MVVFEVCVVSSIYEMSIAENPSAEEVSRTTKGILGGTQYLLKEQVSEPPAMHAFARKRRLSPALAAI